jgi:hypothetical protein
MSTRASAGQAENAHKSKHLASIAHKISSTDGDTA